MIAPFPVFICSPSCSGPFTNSPLHACHFFLLRLVTALAFARRPSRTAKSGCGLDPGVFPFALFVVMLTLSHFHDDKFHWHSSFETLGSNVKTQTKKLVFRSYLMFSIALSSFLFLRLCFLQLFRSHIFVPACFHCDFRFERNGRLFDIGLDSTSIASRYKLMGFCNCFQSLFPVFEWDGLPQSGDDLSL